MTSDDGKTTIENVNTPGRTTRVDGAKFGAMKQAMLACMPKSVPGLTQGEMREAVKPHLDQELFPGGEKAGWWAKSVQLDMEAKGELLREDCKPLRWHLI